MTQICNSFTNIYLNQNIFLKQESDFRFNMYEKKDHSYCFSEYEYLKRIKKVLTNEESISEETNTHKQKLFKYKSIDNLKFNDNIILKEINFELIIVSF